MRTAGLGVYSLAGILAIFWFSGPPTSVCIHAPQRASSQAGFWAPPPGALIPRVQVGLGDAQFSRAPASRRCCRPGDAPRPAGRPRVSGSESQPVRARSLLPAGARQSRPPSPGPGLGQGTVQQSARPRAAPACERSDSRWRPGGSEVLGRRLSSAESREPHRLGRELAPAWGPRKRM